MGGYGDSENPLEDNKIESLKYQIVNMNDELDLIKTLEFVRLIVDLSNLPHLYTQIAGISAGIPQINKVKTVYVDHLKNGYLISDYQNSKWLSIIIWIHLKSGINP